MKKEKFQAILDKAIEVREELNDMEDAWDMQKQLIQLKERMRAVRQKSSILSSMLAEALVNEGE